MTQQLEGKVALVTGGSRGIGAAIATRLAADGAAVALTYASSPARADDVVKTIETSGGKAMAIHADSGDVDAVKRAVAETVRVFGGLDVLVNSSGMLVMGAIDTFSMNDFDRMIAVGRYGRSEEVASLVSYIASPDAAYITGASLKIDGGATA